MYEVTFLSWRIRLLTFAMNTARCSLVYCTGSESCEMESVVTFTSHGQGDGLSLPSSGSLCARLCYTTANVSCFSLQENIVIPGTV